MFEIIDFTRMTDFLIALVFVCMNLGAVIFAVVVQKQIALMNRVFTTPYSGMFKFVAFLFLCASVGLFLFSLITLLLS